MAPTPTSLGIVPEAGQIRVDLTGAPQTMLATLYAKALDADADRPILGDTWAKDAVSRIDYDWPKSTQKSGGDRCGPRQIRTR